MGANTSISSRSDLLFPMDDIGATRIDELGQSISCGSKVSNNRRSKVKDRAWQVQLDHKAFEAKPISLKTLVRDLSSPKQSCKPKQKCILIPKAKENISPKGVLRTPDQPPVDTKKISNWSSSNTQTLICVDAPKNREYIRELDPIGLSEMAFAESSFVEEEMNNLKQNAAVQLTAYAKALVQVARLRKKSTVLEGVCFLITPKPSLTIYASDARNVVVGFNPPPKKLESSNPHFAKSVIQNLLANKSSGWENTMPSVSENFSASESSDGENSMPDYRI